MARKEFEEEAILKRRTTLEVTAYGILFLSSDESSYMTGANLQIDGGWIAR